MREDLVLPLHKTKFLECVYTTTEDSSPWRNTFGKVKKVGERGAVLIRHNFFFFNNNKLKGTKLIIKKKMMMCKIIRAAKLMCLIFMKSIKRKKSKKLWFYFIVYIDIDFKNIGQNFCFFKLNYISWTKLNYIYIYIYI